MELIPSCPWHRPAAT